MFDERAEKLVLQVVIRSVVASDPHAVVVTGNLAKVEITVDQLVSLFEMLLDGFDSRKSGLVWILISRSRIDTVFRFLGIEAGMFVDYP